MSDVTRRLAAGGLGAAAAIAGLVALAATASAGPEPRAESAASIAAKVPGAARQAAAGDVLPAVGDSAPVPSAATLEARLRPLAAAPALGGSVSLDVVDLAGGERLTGIGQQVVRTPASTAKLLTATAALASLGPQSTLSTRAALSGQTLSLVGGGDVLLAADAGDPTAVNGHAGLGDLARAAAKQLRAKGTTSVRVTLDDTLFTGPAVAPGWSKDDVASGFVAPVQALQVNAGRLGTATYAGRAADPALRAANQFAARLRAAGVQVSGVTRAATAPGAEPLAEVRSASVGDQVEYALTESDNTVAEAMARLVARKAGRPAAFAGAGSAVVDEVAALGVPVDGAVLTDGSGLGEGSVVAPATLTGVLVLAASDDHPGLRPVLTGLPIAGVSGTLTDRFSALGQRSAAAGVVRAKTGSLNGVSSLAGTVVDADGRQLAFAVLADRVPGTVAARRALDTLVTTIASCGCG